MDRELGFPPRIRAGFLRFELRVLAFLFFLKSCSFAGVTVSIVLALKFHFYKEEKLVYDLPQRTSHPDHIIEEGEKSPSVIDREGPSAVGEFKTLIARERHGYDEACELAVAIRYVVPAQALGIWRHEGGEVECRVGHDGLPVGVRCEIVDGRGHKRPILRDAAIGVLVINQTRPDPGEPSSQLDVPFQPAAGSDASSDVWKLSQARRKGWPLRKRNASSINRLPDLPNLVGPAALPLR